jgi:hypothetical protein
LSQVETAICSEINEGFFNHAKSFRRLMATLEGFYTITQIPYMFGV